MSLKRVDCLGNFKGKLLGGQPLSDSGEAMVRKSTTSFAVAGGADCFKRGKSFDQVVVSFKIKRPT